MIENFAPNLIRLRTEKEISQKELAKELGISSQTISNIENQIAYPTFTNLEKIANFFKASPTELFGTTEDIALEKNVFKTDEYTQKANHILQAVKSFEDLSAQMSAYGTIENEASITVNHLTDLLEQKPILSSTTGHQLYRHISTGNLIEAEAREGNDSDYEPAFEPSKLEDFFHLSQEDIALIDNMAYLFRRDPKCTPDGKPLTRIGENRYKIADADDEIAYEKSPIQILLDNKENLSKLTTDLLNHYHRND